MTVHSFMPVIDNSTVLRYGWYYVLVDDFQFICYQTTAPYNVNMTVINSLLISALRLRSSRYYGN